MGGQDMPATVTVKPCKIGTAAVILPTRLVFSVGSTTCAPRSIYFYLCRVMSSRNPNGGSAHVCSTDEVIYHDRLHFIVVTPRNPRVRVLRF
jgi:hypothetical protein